MTEAQSPISNHIFHDVKINMLSIVVRKNEYYFFPFNSGHNPAKTAATPEAPPPSTTAFSISTHLKIAIATHSSDTVTILSIRGAESWKYS